MPRDNDFNWAWLNCRLRLAPASFPTWLVKNRAETIAVIPQAQTVFLSKSRDLRFAPLAVLWPDAAQFFFIDGAVFRRL